MTNDSQDESNDNLNCGDVDERNIPVGNNDPNKLDVDGDGIGCETDEGNDSQINNDGKVPKPTTNLHKRLQKNLMEQQMNHQIIFQNKQKDRWNGVSNEQPTEGGDANDNGSNDDEEENN